MLEAGVHGGLDGAHLSSGRRRCRARGEGASLPEGPGLVASGRPAGPPAGPAKAQTLGSAEWPCGSKGRRSWARMARLCRRPCRWALLSAGPADGQSFGSAVWPCGSPERGVGREAYARNPRLCHPGPRTVSIQAGWPGPWNGRGLGRPVGRVVARRGGRAGSRERERPQSRRAHWGVHIRRFEPARSPSPATSGLSPYGDSSPSLRAGKAVGLTYAVRAQFVVQHFTPADARALCAGAPLSSAVGRT